MRSVTSQNSSISRLILVACASLTMVSCGPKFQANEGSTRTTYPGDPIDATWLLGKWDLDGDRTNTVNGNPGLTAIPSDIIKNVFGEGWRFQADGVLKVDVPLGTVNGGWELDGDQLIIQPPKRRPKKKDKKDKEGEGESETEPEDLWPPKITYTAGFRDGYLYLKNEDGRYLVFELNKFFGY